MELTREISKNNYRSYLWHAVFLALTTNFIDLDTVIPSMILKAGGGSTHIGLVTAILLGGTSFFQLFFSGYLSRSSLKKKFLLTGINLRVVALGCLGLLLLEYDRVSGSIALMLIFVLIFLFSVSGAFANVSYVDILGKSIMKERRKRFFSIKQLISGIGIFFSALVVREILKRLDFPENYTILFIGAAFLLFTGSLGFWKIREVRSGKLNKLGLLKLFGNIPHEFRQNPNLRYYIILLNSLGLGISLLPFLIVFAEDHLGLTGGQVGNYLLFRVTGMILVGYILFRLSSRFIYKQVMIGSVILGSVIPLVALVMINFPSMFQYMFILTGFFFTSYRVAKDGILIEITEEENRAFYTGIAGASNLSIILFPLAAGLLIKWLGFMPVFIGISVLILSTLIFAFKLDCTRKPEYEAEFLDKSM